MGRELKKSGALRLERVRIAVGRMTAVEPESLRFCFEACVKDTPMDGARLDIVDVPVTGRCSRCTEEFRMDDLSSPCPACGASSIVRLTGTELKVVSISAA
ncbi:MAG: hydrogenase maturation nickel metallochaperone HypA [Deltaproteobacteria bacterium]|nr:hydrogenase maturation nickel metallochaperone HypA [Deltaproteobacteria bacterium]